MSSEQNEEYWDRLSRSRGQFPGPPVLPSSEDADIQENLAYVDMIFNDLRNNSPVSSDSESQQDSDKPITFQGGYAQNEDNSLDREKIAEIAEELKNETVSPSPEVVDVVTMSDSEEELVGKQLEYGLNAPAPQLPPVHNDAPPIASGESDGQLNSKIEKFKEYFRNNALIYIDVPKKKRGLGAKDDPVMKPFGRETNKAEQAIALNSGTWANMPGGEEWLNNLAVIANNASCDPSFLPSISANPSKLKEICEGLQIPDYKPGIRIPGGDSQKQANGNLNRFIVLMMILAKNEKIIFHDISAPLPVGEPLDLDPPFFDNTASTFQFIDMAAALPS